MKQTFMDSRADPSVREASLITNMRMYGREAMRDNDINLCDWEVLPNVIPQNFSAFDLKFHTTSDLK